MILVLASLFCSSVTFADNVFDEMSDQAALVMFKSQLRDPTQKLIWVSIPNEFLSSKSHFPSMFYKTQSIKFVYPRFGTQIEAHEAKLVATHLFL